MNNVELGGQLQELDNSVSFEFKSQRFLEIKKIPSNKLTREQLAEGVKLNKDLLRTLYQDTDEYRALMKLVHEKPDSNEGKITKLIKRIKFLVGERNGWLQWDRSGMMMRLNSQKVITDQSGIVREERSISKTYGLNDYHIFPKLTKPAEGKIMLYHWAEKDSTHRILKEGLVPSILTESGSGGSIFNYATADLNNDWVKKGIGGQDKERSEFSLLQIEASGLEVVTWLSEWSGLLFSTNIFGEKGFEKYYQWMVDHGKNLASEAKMPDILSEDNKDDWVYSHRLKAMVNGGLFGPTYESDELMFYYASPHRIREVEPWGVPMEIHKQIFKARWKGQEVEWANRKKFMDEMKAEAEKDKE